MNAPPHPKETSAGYRIVRLSTGAYSVHSLAHGETFHPVVGPVAEAQALYVDQLDLVERVREHSGEFVIWDVGLGAAANVLTVLRSLQEVRSTVRLLSFDHTFEPLRFALLHPDHLPYLRGYEVELQALVEKAETNFCRSACTVRWSSHLADFPTLVGGASATGLPKPHLVMFDAFSPATNPAMWTLPLFQNLFRLLIPERPCSLPTYSRSTMLRVTLLLAGFFVGVGHATGEKEETTIASNARELIKEPLAKSWLRRVQRSTSAEPLVEPVYRQASLSTENWRRLEGHPQFAS